MFRTRGLSLIRLQWQSVLSTRPYQAPVLQQYPISSLSIVSRFYSVNSLPNTPPFAPVGNDKKKIKKLTEALKKKNKVPESEIEARRRELREEQKALIQKQAAAVALQGEPSTTPRRPVEAKRADDNEEDETMTQRIKNTVPLPSIVEWIDRHNLGRRRRHVTKQTKEDEREILSRQRKMQRKFKFVAGAGRPSSFLEQGESPLPEVAFAGRSNVGKSSLINALALARVAATSPKPGTTRTIDWYLWPKKLLFVDVPGYGFAYAKEDLKDSWQTMMRAFLQTRRNLKRVYLLVDSRHGLKQTDREMIDLLVQSKKKCQIVLTKVDLVEPDILAKRATVLFQELVTLGVNLTSHLHMVSSHQRQGLLALQDEIEGLSQAGEDRSREYTRKGQERSDEEKESRYKKFVSGKQAKRSEKLWEHGNYRNWKDANADAHEEEEIEEVLQRSKNFLAGKPEPSLKRTRGGYRSDGPPDGSRYKARSMSEGRSWSSSQEESSSHQERSPSVKRTPKPLPEARLVTEEQLSQSPRRPFWDDFDNRVKDTSRDKPRGREARPESSSQGRSRSSERPAWKSFGERPERRSFSPRSGSGGERRSFDSDKPRDRPDRPRDRPEKSFDGERRQERRSFGAPDSRRRSASEPPAGTRDRGGGRDRASWSASKSPARDYAQKPASQANTRTGADGKPMTRRERRLQDGITKPGTLTNLKGRKKGKPSIEKRTVRAARQTEHRKNENKGKRAKPEKGKQSRE